MKYLVPIILSPFILSSLTSCSDTVASPAAPPENGAQFKDGEGLLLTEQMSKAIGLQVAEVSEAKVGAVVTLSLQTTQDGNELGGWLTKDKAAGIQPGMEVELRPTDATGTALKGRVEKVVGSPFPALGDFELTVSSEKPLKAGTSSTATLRFPAGEAVTAVPRSALLTTAEGHFIYARNGRFFVRTPVKVGAVSDDHVEIAEGLYTGDEIVTAPVMSLWLAELQVLRGGKPCTCGH